MSGIIQVNESNFDAEVTQSTQKVLLDCSATWCGPCKKQKPILEQFVITHPQIKVCEVDADDSANLLKRFGVRSVPTLLVIVNGQIMNRKTGLMDLKSLQDFVDLK